MKTIEVYKPGNSFLKSAEESSSVPRDTTYWRKTNLNNVNTILTMNE